MSTGLDCRFYEKTAGNWYYDLEQYSRREEYDTYGPFPTFQKAHDHLQDHHANPGGYSIDALPGCKHDLLEKLEHEPGFSFCNRCGDRIDTRTDDAKRKQLWEEACARNGDTLIIYALMGDGKHLTAEQTLTLSALNIPGDTIRNVTARAKDYYDKLQAAMNWTSVREFALVKVKSVLPKAKYEREKDFINVTIKGRASDDTREKLHAIAKEHHIEICFCEGDNSHEVWGIRPAVG